MKVDVYIRDTLGQGQRVEKIMLGNNKKNIATIMKQGIIFETELSTVYYPPHSVIKIICNKY